VIGGNEGMRECETAKGCCSRQAGHEGAKLRLRSRKNSTRQEDAGIQNGPGTPKRPGAVLAANTHSFIPADRALTARL